MKREIMNGFRSSGSGNFSYFISALFCGCAGWNRYPSLFCNHQWIRHFL